MTKSLKFSVVLLMVAATVGMVTESACGQVEMDFLVTRDVGILGHAQEQLSSAGEADRIRPFKSNQNTTIIDFNTADIATFLANNPNTSITAELFVFPQDGTFPSDIGIQTVESTNDWVEGDGAFSGVNKNWSSETSAATYFYASTALDSSGNLDSAASLEWNDPDSGPYTFTSRTADHALRGVPSGVGGGGSGANPTPAFENSTKFLSADLNAQVGADSASVAIDADIVLALANDANNRGLRFGEISNADNSGKGSNGRINSRDQNNFNLDLIPFLKVTLTPIVGNPGDFDGDGDVDGADFLKWQRDGLPASDLTLWQNNFPAPLASLSAVPEPSSIALLALSSTLLLARRNSRRSL